jgi:hypothetical protein
VVDAAGVGEDVAAEFPEVVNVSKRAPASEARGRARDRHHRSAANHCSL